MIPRRSYLSVENPLSEAIHQGDCQSFAPCDVRVDVTMI